MGPLYNVHQTTNKTVTQRKWQNWNHSFTNQKYSIEYPPKENIILIIVESLLSFPTDLKNKWNRNYSYPQQISRKRSILQ